MDSSRKISDVNIGGSILLVAESSTEISYLASEITEAGYSLAVVSDLNSEALDLAVLDPDLLLLEAPDNNVDLIRIIDQANELTGSRNIPLVLLEAHGINIDRSLAFASGVRDILKIPVPREEFLVKVAHIVRARQVGLTLETTAKQLVQASIMRDKLSRMIVHDLRSPLSSLVLALESVASPEELLEMPAETMELARAQVNMAAELCDQMLYVGRLERNELVPAPCPSPLNDTITAAISMLIPQATVRSIRIDVNAVDQSLVLDHKLLSRIILNLVGNALKASSENDVISVTGSVEGNVVTVIVEDHGLGIPEELHESVFDLYSQPGEQLTVQGSGIGLAFCRLAVNAMGGNISLASQPNRGSVFTVTVPAE